MQILTKFVCQDAPHDTEQAEGGAVRGAGDQNAFAMLHRISFYLRESGV